LTTFDVLAIGIPLALVIRIVTIAATLLSSGRAGRCRRIAMAGSVVASAMATSVAVRTIASGQSIEGVLIRHAASGITLDYSMTPLSAWFVFVLGVIAIPIAIYSAGYFAHAIPPSRIAVVGAAVNVLLGSVEVVFVANDVIAFLFAWELMTLSTAALVATEHQERSNRRAAYLYLVMSHVGTGCLVAAFLLLAEPTGLTSFSTLLQDPGPPPFREALFAQFAVGVGVKAGLVPLHVWLPEAHPAAPSSISALMSSVLITAGMYGLVRVCAFGLGVPAMSWGLVLMAAGTMSAILGVLYAVTQSDVKRLLAYSTIENAGIMTLALGAGMVALAQGHAELATIAVAASLAHVLNHALFKATLFLCAGNMVMATGTRQIEALGGLLRRMPWTGACFLIGAMAISGLPLLNGFVSEWLTFQSLLLGFASTPGLVRLNFPLAGAMLALTSALAAACFVRVFGISFLAVPRSRNAEAVAEVSGLMLAPPAFLAFACIVLGLFPGMMVHALSGVIASLPGLTRRIALFQGGPGLTSAVPSFDHVVPIWFGVAIAMSLLSAVWLGRRHAGSRAAPTWGCGGVLTSQTEYTATAFSKPLMMIFRAVYRPTRTVESLAERSPYFPSEVRYRAVVEPTFERYVYDPLVAAVLRAAHGMKVLQAGSLHAYLGYVLLLGVLLLLWLGGPS
jgi:hydrogenase-4 component B